jgi:hypothetical protein
MSREELEKLTVIKLRELAVEYPEIVGATGMKKEDLVVAILKARGEPVKKEKKKPTKIFDVKKEIRSIKKEKEKAITEKDGKKLSKLRKKIKRLKRQTRQMASEKKTPDKKEQTA